MNRAATTKLRCLGLVTLAGFLSACQQDMANQPRYKPLAASDFFKDGRAARPVVPGTVARGHLNDDEHLYTGKVNGVLVDAFPYPVTREMLARGRDRFAIYCTPCHGAVGDGLGMVVQRGLRRPPSLHIERLQKAPVGHFFDVMTNGLGAMQDYSAQVPVGDRWAVVAYIRALQLSQNAKLADVPPKQRGELEKELKP